MFTRKTLNFLKELDQNNNRDWFAENKDRYENEVRTPALEYIEAMAPAFERISPYFEAKAKKVGGSLMRVYRDTRFGKDKTPYKTNIGIHFRHVRAKDVHAPGFYLHIEPGDVFIGAGIWRPESSTLQAVRQLIDEHPKEWQALNRKIIGKSGFSLGGDSLKRPPKGYDKDHPLIDDLKRKDFIATMNLPMGHVYKADFHKETAKLFKSAAPLVKFICEADDLMF